MAVDDAFRSRFVEALSQRAQTIRKHLRSLTTGGGESCTASRDALDEELHRLTGTASTLEFVELAEASRRLEHELRAAWDDPTELAARASPQRAATQALLEALDTLLARPAPSSSSKSSKLRVAIIDDDPDILELASDALNADGRFDVMVAGSLRNAESFRDLPRPDMVLLDARLERNCAPSYALARVRQLLGEAPRIVFFTAIESTTERAALLQAGAIAIVDKPFDPRRLAERLLDLAKPAGRSPPHPRPASREVSVLSSPVAVVMFDAKMIATSSNEAARALLGGADVVGKAIGVAFDLAPALAARAGDLRPGETIAFEGSFGQPQKRTHVVIDRMSDGSCVALLDPSHRANRDPWTNSLLASNDLVQGLVHNIMNPLAAIRSVVQFGSSQVERTHRAYGLLAQIEPLTTRISDALNATALVTRPSLSARTRIDVGELLAIADRVSQGRTAAVTCEVAAGVDRLLLPVAALEDALGELVANAFEASASAVSFRVHTEYTARGRELVIVVDDDGTGLDRRNADRLFEPFFTTKVGHFGLGLTRARKRAREAGGDVVLGVPRAYGASILLRVRAD